MTDKYKAHPDNATGDFYVVNGCCTACGVPDSIAPELFAWDNASHCFVKRQPTTSDEIDDALNVIVGQELQCVRYRGKDQEILRRLAEVGEARQCDVSPPEGIVPALRNHVTFDSESNDIAQWSPEIVLDAFRDHIFKQSSVIRIHATRIKKSPLEASLSISWVEGQQHKVVASRINLPRCKWLIRHSDHLGASELIDKWLKEDERFTDVRWYTAPEWNGARHWRNRPW